MYKKGNKIIASLVVFMMLITNMSTLGIQIGEVIAASSELNQQNSKTNNANVEFDVYFEQEENKTHEAITNIGEENKIVANISVKNSGYIKNAMVEFIDANFKAKNETNSQEKVLGVENNKLYLNQIDAGENIKFEIPIEFEHGKQINISQFDKINNIKLTGTYVNENGKERKIEKEIKLGVKWTAKVQTSTIGEISKYVPFNVNGQKGLIMQMLVKSFVNDNMLPIKENVIEISVPKINNINPKNINVYSKNSNIEFGKDNYNYNENTNKLTINTQNNINNENQIYWLNAQEEGYIVTYVYPEEVLQGMNEEGTNVNIDINSNIKVYSCDEQVLTSNYKNEVTLKDKIGEIADLKIIEAENLSKAYMYANIKATEKTETIYTQKVSTNIDLPELINEITISMGADKFDKETKTGNTYYKNIKMTKTEFNKFFGEEGFIKIYSGENLIGTIDKSVQEEQIVIQLNNTETITIKTSKPIIAGELTFECEKAVKPEISYTKQQLESFENINLEANIQIVNNETVIVNKDIQGQINLVEPVHQTEIQISDTNLSTVVTNENIEIRAILKTDSIYNKLYKNPKIVIDLPEYIENMNVKNVQLLFDDELTITAANLVQNKNGNKQIIIELNGEQTKYNIGSSYKGANIVITADITANNLTPNKESEIKMTVITENEQIETIQKVNFIAPTGIVTVNKISNFSEGENLMALTNDEQSTLEVSTNAKNATAEIQVINNYNNVINNIQILGRTLTSGTTDTETNQDLNNTFDAPMLSGINTNGLENATIYYSEKGNATTDLQNPENAWNTEVIDFSKVKSYLIVLNNYTMNVGDMVKFTYNAQIPENLGYSQVVNSLYTVYFDNLQEEQTIKDKAKSRKITLQTGVAPDLEVVLNSYSNENSTVRAGQYVKFIATVKNTGTSDIENVKLNITAPSDTLYSYENEEAEMILTRDTSLIEHKDNPVQDIAISYLTKHTEFVQEDFYTGYRDSEETEKTIEVGDIKAGEIKEIEYELKIDDVLISRERLDLEDNADLPEVILNNKVRAIADDMQEEIISNEYKLNLAEGDIAVVIEADKTPSNILTKGDELNYSTRVTHINRYGLINNVVITVKIPNGLMIKNANVENYTYSEEELKSNINIDRTHNVVEFTIDKLETGNEIGCNVLTEVIGENKNITPEVTATVNGSNIHYGNIIKNTISKLDFEITQTNLDNPYVKENENITFEYKITNISDVYCNDFTFENKVPDGMKVVKVETVIGNETTNLKDYTEDLLTINRTFKAGQTIIIRVTMKAKLMQEGQTSKEIENYAKIFGTQFEEKQSNIVKATIEYNEEAHKYNKPDAENPEKPNNPGSTKVISGIAWIDSNKDGERNNEEQLISGMEVRLLKKSTNEVVKQTQTSSTGEYIFTQVEEGDYLVVFIYNSYKYDLTEYKKAGISQSTNSDVINVTMDIDGKDTTVAISDTIKISNSNVRNIDIGLCESEKSDLKLDKYVSNITVTYGNTVKTYDYKNVKLAKIEIPAKNLSNATVIVEYKIIVTNEGAIGNYVKKIVDYIPKDMKFNSELNRDWYESTNGDIYNSSLANTKLESGESKEVTLTLTKKMTDNNVGIVNNNAELYEVYNEEGIQDIDSTPANKVNGEDDMSAADVVISVKTGDAILYTVIISTLICIAIGVSIYYIRKKVLRKI